jgi:hypothetical protein
MIFEDFEEFFPIITPERVATPEEATLPFFSLPKEKRGNLPVLNYTDQFED